MSNGRSNANSDTFAQFGQDKNNFITTTTTYKFTNPISQKRESEPVFCNYTKTYRPLSLQCAFGETVKSSDYTSVRPLINFFFKVCQPAIC
jgi:hypothetical protein